MSGKLGNRVDPAMVREALRYLGSSVDFEALALERMGQILKVLQAIAQDLEVANAQHYAGITPRQRREQFESLARKLEEISEQLNVLGAPYQRHREDHDIPPMRPIGLAEFRSAMADQLTEALSAQYISCFGATPVQLRPGDVSQAPINTWNVAIAIEMQAERIVPDLVNRLATGLREANIQIARNTPSGGPRKNLIRQTLLLNLVALYQEVRKNDDPISYGGGQTYLYKFCSALSRSIGAGQLCGETHVKNAVTEFNSRTFRKTRPLEHPSLSDNGGE